MSDRTEEYRQDWECAPLVEPVRFTCRPRDTAKFMLFPRFLLCLCLVMLARGAYARHRMWEHRVSNQIKHTETVMEMSVAGRLLRHYHTAFDALPKDPVKYIATSLRVNKPHPRGCDFWGTPYRVEACNDGFKVRSAGPDCKFGTRDDLTYTSTYSPTT